LGGYRNFYPKTLLFSVKISVSPIFVGDFFSVFLKKSVTLS